MRIKSSSDLTKFSGSNERDSLRPGEGVIQVELQEKAKESEFPVPRPQIDYGSTGGKLR